MLGETSGHVSLGIAFLVIGLWHLFSCIKLHCLHPRSFHVLPWFPVQRFCRLLEPITIMLVTAVFVAMELFHGREPLSPDGTIPSKNLPHFEHSIIALSFFVYAAFAALFDRSPPLAGRELLHFLQAVAFGQQLLILHLHSTDHMGIEGHYHWLLQTVIFASLMTSLLAIGYPKSFLTSFVRAFSVTFQGVWLVVTGVMLWTPRWIPKGCLLKPEPGRVAIICHSSALHRAKALVNIQFGLYLVILSVASVSLHLVMIRFYLGERVEYRSMIKSEEEQDEAGDCAVESQQKHKLCLSRSSLPL